MTPAALCRCGEPVSHHHYFDCRSCDPAPPSVVEREAEPVVQSGPVVSVNNSSAAEPCKQCPHPAHTFLCSVVPCSCWTGTHGGAAEPAGGQENAASLTIRDALESAQAGVWDAYYGKGIAAEYARSVDAKVREALRLLSCHDPSCGRRP